MIKIIRGISVTVSFIIFGLGSLFLGGLIFPLIYILEKNKEKKLMLFSKLVHKSWNIFVHFLMFIKVVKLEIKDIEKLRGIKNSVIVATHPTYIDVLILISLIPQTTCFAAEKLTRNIFMKNIVGSMFLSAAQPIDNIVDDSKYMLENGFNVLIFPTGKRHHKNEYPKIHKGAALIALKSNKNIVPVRITTDIDFLQENEPIYNAGNKVVTYNIEIDSTIKIQEFQSKFEDEIIQKQEITKEIRNKLYGFSK